MKITEQIFTNVIFYVLKRLEISVSKKNTLDIKYLKKVPFDFPELIYRKYLIIRLS